MAEFTKNGPNIPDRLLRAHEDGNVVFFCGAGISRPLLPDFKLLVRKLFKDLLAPEGGKQAVKQGQYEVAVELLDKQVAGRRLVVRQKIAEILSTERKHLPVMHRPLLDLARTYPDGQMRLVTTNFDRFFQQAGDDGIKSYSTPALPVPNKKWDGLVYLHGLLPEEGNDGLDDLVVSSADFGRAYILEQWAANFVRELFRNYSVCFVGYGINDPVMRYLLDALAADRASGMPVKEMFAFAGYPSSAKKDNVRKEWEGKSVTPILYSNEDKKHSLLHRTINSWASTYKQGEMGKKTIIAKHADSPPPPHTPDPTPRSGQMLWAISDPLAAKHFSRLNPPPPLEWLHLFGDNRFKQDDLPRFGGDSFAFARERDFSFSVVERPTPCELAPWMRLASHRHQSGKWDKVMQHLGEWLLRHMDDPNLILWLAGRGGCVHNEFTTMAESRLRQIAEWERNNKEEELAEMRAASPKSIPSPPMRVLWRLLLSGRMCADGDSLQLYDWQDRLRYEGLSIFLRLRLREMLSPRIAVGEFFSWEKEAKQTALSDAPQHANEILNCNIHLQLSGARDAMNMMEEKPAWRAALPFLLDDFTGLLREALDIMRELGMVNDKYDMSYYALPSIAEHDQNEFAPDWAFLIECARDAWLETKKTNPARARRVAGEWQKTPYPLFKRLAFFAATHDEIINARKALKWLLADKGWWLWTVATQRESIRLMTAIAPGLKGKDAQKLVKAILERPPREIYRNIATEENLDHATWLLLAKLHKAGMVFDEVTQNKLNVLSGKYTWEIADDESDEFPFWRGGVEFRTSRPAPRGYIHPPQTSPELMEWLKKPPFFDGIHDDRDVWGEYCLKNLEATLNAFSGLAQQGCWPADRWGGALRVWSKDGEFVEKSWRAAPMLVGAETDLFKGASHPLASWLREQGKRVPAQDGELFFRLCRRVITTGSDDHSLNMDPLTNAINNPVGMATEGLLRWFFHRGNPQLSADMRKFLTLLCNTNEPRFRPSRVFLAGYALALFGIDEEWTKQTLLPLFDWNKSPTDARAVWYGFLFPYRATPALFREIKHFFLDTAQHCEELGEMGHKYASVLTWLALEPGEKMFSTKQFKDATKQLHQEGLCRAADVVIEKLESAEDRRGEVWRGSVARYFVSVWPKGDKNITTQTAEQIARVCIAAGDNFADAVNQLNNFLVPIEHPGRIYHGYLSSELCAKFPEEALRLIAAITGDGPVYAHGKLRKYLDTIRQARPELADTPEFIRLKKLCE